MAKDKIIKCKYAGDPEDEYCKNCDGIHPVDDAGNVCEAVDCGGYAPAEQEQEPEATQPATEVPASQGESWGDSQFATQANKQPAAGITSVIRAESGVSREVNGTWYKFTFSEERILPEGCDIEAEKQALWDSVNAEVDAQVDSVIN